ncbi:MAG: HEPN domain-containing protein [Firmicutes bacterium]|nr:HEPN domain-containing protein [Candidatus Colimorpha enterica]
MGSRRKSSHDSQRYFDWMERAEADLYSALLLKELNGDNCNAAFHCQQCIEKALKAYVLFMQNKHIDGHNLTYLCRSAVKIDPKFTEWLDESVELNRYYIETRYPTDEGFDVTDGDLEKIYVMAGEMYKFISGVIGTGE